MNVAQIIEHKRDGGELTDREIEFMVKGFTERRIPDYQMSALAMAVFFRSMTIEETTSLTREMLHSGTVLDWPAGCAPLVDKHSTGGIGDKISFILAPMLASCGLLNPMISGRGLGATGGTLDKLESIQGYRCNLSLGEFEQVVMQVGCSITGTSRELAPADQKLYALRDVTGTVPSIPLITASILSKKLAERLDVLVLDVKYGSGAFMKELESAKQLAHSLVAVANRLGVKTTALITDMNEPLGRMVGNSIEVDESLDVLRGELRGDLLDLSIELGIPLLVGGKIARDREDARAALQKTIGTGTALEKFEEMVLAHGGDLHAPRERATRRVYEARHSGFLQRIDAAKLGYAVIQLGGGRRLLTDQLDHFTGIEMRVRVGDSIDQGQPLIDLFTRGELSLQMTTLLGQAFVIGSEPPIRGDLVVQTVE